MNIQKKVIELNRLQFAEATIMLERKPFSIKRFPMFHYIYTSHFSELILKCGRQVGKTVTEHNLMFIESVAIPGFRHLYVSPSQDQTKKFSRSKLNKTLLGSPLLKAVLMGGNEVCNVFHHMYSNQSEIFLSYAGDHPERIRGISADRIHYDELQDIPYDGNIPVINECTSMSDYKYITYAGTPKSTDNTIEFVWLKSNQNEWAVPCPACKKWSYYVNTDGLGRKGIICLNCKKYVNPLLGHWIETNPGAHISGFHIPQVIIPENNPICAKNTEEYEKYLKNWQRLLRKLESGAYSVTTFLNEVIGVSTAGGARLLTLDELKSMADESKENRHWPSESWNPRNHRLIFAGLDWGGNGKEGESRTVLVIFSLNYDGSIQLQSFRIYPVENPLDSIEDAIKTMRAWGVQCIGADAGEGTLANPILRREFGYGNVYPIRYLDQKNILEWDDALHQGCYKANRTSLMDNFAFLLKKGQGIKYPRISDSTVLFNDMLAVFEETTQTGKKIWNRHPKMPDDGFQAQVFAWTAMKVRTGDLNWYSA